MAYFNEDNVTEQMCIEVAKEVGYVYHNMGTQRGLAPLCPLSL